MTHVCLLRIGYLRCTIPFITVSLLTFVQFTLVFFANMSMLLTTLLNVSFPCRLVQLTVLLLQLVILFLQNLILLHNQAHFLIFLPNLFPLTEVRSIDGCVFAVQFLLERVDKYLLMYHSRPILLQFRTDLHIFLNQNSPLSSHLDVQLLIMSLVQSLFLESCVFFEEFLVFEGKILDNFQDVLHLYRKESTRLRCIFMRSKRR